MSAKAMPTDLVFVLSPAEMDVEAVLIAMTMGADKRSELTKRRSSTAWRFPGDAFFVRTVQGRRRMSGVEVQTSFSNLNLEHFLPWPGSGSHISTLNCFEVKASRKNVNATFSLKVTLGKPAAFPPVPRYLMTEFVRKTCVATYEASGPWTE